MWHLEQRERLVLEVGERRATPESEGRAEQLGSLGRLARRPGPIRQAHEAVQVDLLGSSVEQVARIAPDDHVRPQRAA